MNASSDSSPNSGPKLPKTYKAFITKFPPIGAAHENIARFVEQLGPLERKTCELIKIGISIGAGMESATKSHVRRAREHGATIDEIEQAVLLALNTRGFPATVAAWAWAWEQIDRDRPESQKADS